MRNIWSSYKIITVWCIKNIWLVGIDVWDHGSTSTVNRHVQNIPTLFTYWQRKHHIYIFFFWRIVPQYNQNTTLKLIRRVMPEHQASIDKIKNIVVDSIVCKVNWKRIGLLNNVNLLYDLTTKMTLNMKYGCANFFSNWRP